MPERRIPSDEQERAGQYPDLLRRRHCLIVLDKAADESQVRPLLPGVGPSMALITEIHQRRRIGQRVDIGIETVWHNSTSHPCFADPAISMRLAKLSAYEDHRLPHRLQRLGLGPPYR